MLCFVLLLLLRVNGKSFMLNKWLKTKCFVFCSPFVLNYVGFEMYKRTVSTVSQEQTTEHQYIPKF